MINFDLDQLQNILKNVYALSHVKASIFDANMDEVAFYPERLCSYCALIRSKTKGEKTCNNSDIKRLEQVKKTKEIKKFICPHGLTEVFAPITIDNEVVGYILIGQFIEEQMDINQLLEKVKYLKLDNQLIENSIKELPIVETKDFDSTIFLINLCIKYIILNDSIKVSKNHNIDLIVKYIDEHIYENLTVKKICQEFYFSRSNLYFLFKKYYGDSIMNFINNKKLDKAKEILIKNKEIRISELSEKLNIEYNYFSKIFKKRFKIGPKKFQKEN